jgi:hypothetical protein
MTGMDRVFANARIRYVIPTIIIGTIFPFIVAAYIAPHWLETDESSVEMALLSAASYLAIFIGGLLWIRGPAVSLIHYGWGIVSMALGVLVIYLGIKVSNHIKKKSSKIERNGKHI